VAAASYNSIGMMAIAWRDNVGFRTQGRNLSLDCPFGPILGPRDRSAREVKNIRLRRGEK
jgi:hypothetical protein